MEVRARQAENIDRSTKYSSRVFDSDLRQHEDKGEHLMEKHVEISNEALTQRLIDDPDITGSSSFNNLETAHKVCIENTIKYITAFLKSDLSTQEKEEFIEFYAEIYFPSLKPTPIEWLEQTVETLKQALKNSQ